MKRLIAALAALLITTAPVADAKVLVVYDDSGNTASGGITAAKYFQQQARANNVILQFLRRLGVDYKVATPDDAKTEFCRTGQMVWNFGTAGAFTEQFDGVIHTQFAPQLEAGNNASIYNTRGAAYNPDSLTLTATVAGTGASHGLSLPTVPQLFFIVQNTSGYPSNSGSNLRDRVGDTTGVGAIGNILPVSSPYAAQYSACVGLVGDATSKAWIPTGFQCGFSGFNSTTPAGGLRPILRSRMTTTDGQAFNNNVLTTFPSTWMDPDNYSWNTAATNNDSLCLWDRPMSHVTGAKAIEFAYIWGTSGCSDSVNLGVLQTAVGCELSLDVLACAVAHFDSLCGGKVIGTTTAGLKPLVLSPVVKSAFSRSGYNNPGGIAPDDTTRAKFNYARLSGYPITMAAAPESAAAYVSEFAWYPSSFKFAMESRIGASRDTALVSMGNASIFSPVDIFGRYRNRFAVGDSAAHTVTGKDTSICALWYAASTRLDSVLSAQGIQGRRSNLAIAPGDDWTPKNINGLQGNPGPSVDSVLYALQKAGATGLLIAVQTPQSYQRSPVGYEVGGQQTWPGPLAAGFRLLAHSGYRICGSRWIWDFRADSTQIQFQSVALPATQYVGTNLIHDEVDRAWGQLLLPTWRDYDVMPYDRVDGYDGVLTPKEDLLYGVMYGSVFRMSANDFGGGYGSPNPSDVGYWTLVSLQRSFAAVNKLAGRTIVRFGYPNDVQP